MPQAFQQSRRAEAHADTVPVYALTPFTLLDFPQRSACIVWLSGCNMRCGYCHNPQIVKGKGAFGTDRVLSFLETRRGLLDGVVLSGGEATLYPGLVGLAARIKAMGFALKLDTNGTRPDIVHALVSGGLVDYIALDYKAPRSRFEDVTGCGLWERFHETLAMLAGKPSPGCEVRTTVHADLLDENDINAIIDDLSNLDFRGTYFVQNFIPRDGSPTLGRLPAPSRRFDTGRIANPDSFAVEFRNFPPARH